MREWTRIVRYRITELDRKAVGHRYQGGRTATIAQVVGVLERHGSEGLADIVRWYEEDEDQ